MTADRRGSDAAFLETFEGCELLPHIVRLLAEGAPVRVHEIAAAAGIPEDDVERVLRHQPGTDWADDGRLVGFGLTLRPTAHHFTTAGRTLYTWCASDTLYFSIVLGLPALVESTCPATGQAIRVDLEPGAVAAVSPAEAVVSQRCCTELVGDIRTEFCNHGHFFSSPAAAASWLAEHPDGEVLDVAEAFGRCQTTCHELGWATVTPAR